ncbi:MAG: hypothetical protein EBS05_22400 [Proteobacteria bacterium]|nr:hypothetical protein [Pseudomonadota bacterium]
MGQFNSGRDFEKVITFSELANHYRVFAVPKTVLTKGTADALGKWLATELKKGSNHYGKLLERGLFNEREMLGSEMEWKEQAGVSLDQDKTTHRYRRRNYIRSLIELIYPDFNLEALLAPPTHRARGKKYIPKVRQK